MPTLLKATRFGEPILRQKAHRLSVEEMKSTHVQTLSTNMRHTLEKRKYGVGLAAPQVGESIALSVIGIKPTPTRPDREKFDSVIINPVIVETYGNRTQLWESCVSCGTNKDTLYAKVPRYKKIKLQWYDERAQKHEKILDDFIAHVAQHETDHLNGVLFVDRVKDTSTYMMADEYKKRIVEKRTSKQ